MNSGTIIKLLRTAEGISQVDLSEKIGVTRAYLSQVENNHKQPGLSFLKEVSKTFGIPLVLLLADEEYSNSEVYNELKNILGDILAAKLKSVKK
ncbi:MAG: helix-turn-helix transcriptional regulator [Colwellia sp.]|nr:helix-turn-helix transcriptional regulator [Colwellia sp.]